MANNKEKITIEYPNGKVETGYYNDKNKFILHSFDDEPTIICKSGSKYWYKDDMKHRDNNLPAIIWDDGSKFWYKDGEEYWLIENVKYFNLADVYEKYQDKIIKTKDNISQHLTNMNIDFIFYLSYYVVGYCYVILDDTNRNEVILKYG